MTRFLVFLSTFLITVSAVAVSYIWMTGKAEDVRDMIGQAHPAIPQIVIDRDPHFVTALKMKDHAAQIELARALFKGQDLQKDEGLGAAWVKYAADHGSKRAAGLLGVLYLGGIGIEQNIDKAQEWLFKSGDRDAGELAMRLRIMTDALQKLPPEEQKQQIESNLAAARNDIRLSFQKMLEQPDGQAFMSIKNIAPVSQE